MKTFLRAALVSLALLLAFHTGQAQTPQNPKVHEWWREFYPLRPLNSPDAKKLPRIAVKGNRFVDPQGKQLLLRGIAISDPDKIEAQGHWSKEHFLKVQQFGAKVVRIPVHPVAWRERGAVNYLKLLDDAVAWCTELNMYVIIDWHSIGNLKAELFQDPMYVTSLAETGQFWRTIAAHFAGHNTLAFCELFNEPTTYRNQLGQVSWEDWKKINEDLIKIIRAYDRETIPLVAGFDWAYDLTPLLINPIQAEGIGYVTHPYANKRSKPWEPKWEENFGFAAANYPIIATEFGFGRDRKDGPNSGYGDAIINYLESKNISWVVWVFDPNWGPQLISSWDTYALTESGEFFSKAMKNKPQVP